MHRLQEAVNVQQGIYKTYNAMAWAASIILQLNGGKVTKMAVVVNLCVEPICF